MSASAARLWDAPLGSPTQRQPLIGHQQWDGARCFSHRASASRLACHIQENCPAPPVPPVLVRRRQPS